MFCSGFLLFLAVLLLSDSVNCSSSLLVPSTLPSLSRWFATIQFLPSWFAHQACPVILSSQKPKSFRLFGVFSESWTRTALSRFPTETKRTRTSPFSKSPQSQATMARYSTQPDRKLTRMAVAKVKVEGRDSSNKTDIHKLEPRIVGGHAAGGDLAGSLVMLVGDGMMCSGTLVALTVVITAAHCNVRGGGLWTAYVGGQTGLSGTAISVADVIKMGEDKGEGQGLKYDFAILTLASEAPNGSRPMRVNVNASVPRAGSFARVAGYGNTDESPSSGNYDFILYQVDLPITTKDKCIDIYNAGHEEEGYPGIDIDHKRQICAGYERRDGCDSCQGDSGGPMLQYDEAGNPVLVGVVSFGFGCGHAGYPGVYVRTSPYGLTLERHGIIKSEDAVAVFHDETSTGLMIGIIVGAIIAVIAVIVAVILIVTCSKRSKKGHSTPPPLPLSQESEQPQSQQPIPTVLVPALQPLYPAQSSPPSHLQQSSSPLQSPQWPPSSQSLKPSHPWQLPPSVQPL